MEHVWGGCKNHIYLSCIKGKRLVWDVYERVCAYTWMFKSFCGSESFVTSSQHVEMGLQLMLLELRTKHCLLCLFREIHKQNGVPV